MGNAAKELKNSDEGAGLSILHNISKELEGQPWYIQSLGAKLLPAIAESIQNAKPNAQLTQG